MVFDIVMLIALIYTATIDPYLTSFYSARSEEIEFQLTVDIFIDIVFAIDIILSFFTPIVKSNRKLETRHSKIAKKYLKGWFFIDVITTFPFYLIEKIDTMEIDPLEDRQVLLVKILKLQRIYKIFRILKLIKLFRVRKINKLNLPFFKEWA
jgi:hypothetical protein